jgi:hypothetical protein
VVITGPPRAGKTFASLLLNKLADTVVLNEPMWKEHFRDSGAVLSETGLTFRDMRASLSKKGVARAKSADDQAVALGRVGDKKRFFVRFDKPLSDGFLLAIEHSAGFTAVLPDLMKQYPCYAIIRHPLVLLACWSRHKSPVSRGFSPIAEALDESLRRALAATPGTLDRQIYLLSWWFEKCLCLPKESIMTYEDIVASGGKALKVITPAALCLEEPLVSENALALEGWKEAGEAGRRLLAAEGAFWRFYTRESVETLMEPVP